MKCDQKEYLQQNTVSLEQKVYAKKENITQPLVVMVEAFRRSGFRKKSYFWFDSQTKRLKSCRYRVSLYSHDRMIHINHADETVFNCMSIV